MFKNYEDILKRYLVEAHKTLFRTRGSKKILVGKVRQYIEERHSGYERTSLLEAYCNIGWVQQNMRQIDKTIAIDKSVRPAQWYLIKE